MGREGFGKPSGGMEEPIPNLAPRPKLSNSASWTMAAEVGAPSHADQKSTFSRRGNECSRESLLLGGTGAALGAGSKFLGRSASSEHFVAQPQWVRDRCRGQPHKPKDNLGRGSDFADDPGPSMRPMTTNQAMHSAPHKSFLNTLDKRPPPPYLDEQRKYIERMMATKFYDGRPTSAQAFTAPVLPPSATKRQPIYPPTNPTAVGDRDVKMQFETAHAVHYPRRPLVGRQKPFVPSSSFNLNPERWTTHQNSNRDRANRPPVRR